MTINLCFTNVVASQIVLNEGTVLEINEIAVNLDVPWDMVYDNDQWIWFTELSGNIKRINVDSYELEEIHSVSDVEQFGLGAGMHSIVLHPEFASIPHLFVHYTNSINSSKVVRYEYEIASNSLTNPLIILNDIPAGVSHNGSRMVIKDGKLFISIGDGFVSPNSAQDLNSLNGKVLRLNLDGTIPADNPISNSYIWSLGHRNPQGLCLINNKLFSSEHGSSGNDEINNIEANRNYGWPEVEGFCDLPSEVIFCNNEMVFEPIWNWSNTVAPSGIDYYSWNIIQEWENSLLVCSLKDKKLIQLQLDDNQESIIEEFIYLENNYGRLRDVLVIPDGRVFICTSNRDFFGTPNENDDKIIELVKDDSLTIQEADFKDKFKIQLIEHMEILNITSENNSYFEVNIFSSDGSLVFEEKNILDNFNFCTNVLSSGLYFISIKSKGYSFTEKMVFK